ncbi:hypothetical protein YC2023_000213 [Brassica napus]
MKHKSNIKLTNNGFLDIHNTIEQAKTMQLKSKRFLLLQRRDKSKTKRQNARTLTQRWLQEASTEATGNGSGDEELIQSSAGGIISSLRPRDTTEQRRHQVTEGDRESPQQQVRQQVSEVTILIRRHGCSGLSSGPCEPESESKKRDFAESPKKRSSESVSLNTAITPNGGREALQSLERQTTKGRTGTSQTEKGRRRQRRYTILTGGTRSDLTQICSD